MFYHKHSDARRETVRLWVKNLNKVLKISIETIMEWT